MKTVNYLETLRNKNVYFRKLFYTHEILVPHLRHHKNKLESFIWNSKLEKLYTETLEKELPSVNGTILINDKQIKTLEKELRSVNGTILINDKQIKHKI